MDPLTALGLASNVLSFVQFASELIQTSTEISRSASGNTADIAALDKTYTRLRSLSTGLQSCRRHSCNDDEDSPSDKLDEVMSALKDLAQDCESDCNGLMSVIAKLKVDPHATGKCRSFRAALKIMWEKDKITALGERLNKTQTTMTLHICTIASFHMMGISSNMRRLQRRSEDLHVNQGASFKVINATLTSMEKRFHASEERPSVPRITLEALDKLQKQFSQLSVSEKDLSKEQSLLKSITFESRPVRQESIAEAHRQTFDWALQTNFNESQTDASGNVNLGDWLKNGDGIFWVSGKPGSGKSTLMKFIANERRTLELLSQWASPDKMITASHYFWSAGTTLQKSHQGLLRSLLYEVFRQCPQLMPIGCPDRWSDPDSRASWSISYLQESLSRIFKTNSINFKFCFFIDGLDEYIGDHLQLCQILKNLAESGKVKLCLSSRRWNVFDEAFGSGPLKLFVHDLTKEDIRNYTRSRLEEHPRWNSVNVPEQGEWLISEISEKAWGVFLWAFLVTKLLRDGLTNRDRFSDLKRRLDSFPEELEDFFAQILDSIEPFYRSKMSTTLQIAMAAQEPLSYLVYDWHDKEYDDGDYSLRMPISTINHAELSEIEDITISRLDGRTRGLLELPRGQNKVTFLHRTVKDFLNTNKMSESLVSKMAPGLEFRAKVSILKAHLACLKSFPNPELFDSIYPKDFATYGQHRLGQGSECETMSLVDDALVYAATIDYETYPCHDHALGSILDEFDKVLANRLAENMYLRGQYPTALFRTKLIASGVFTYLQRKVNEDPHYLLNCHPASTAFLLSPSTAWARDHQHVYQQGIQIFRQLLENGNLEASRVDKDSVNVWTTLFRCFTSEEVRIAGRDPGLFVDLLEEGIFSMLLKQHPNSNAEIWDKLVGNYSEAWATYLRYSFKMPTNPDVQRAYLQILKALLDSGVNLSQSSSFDITRYISASFLDRLEPTATTASRSDKEGYNSAFLARVAHVLLEKLTEIGLGRLIESMQKTLQNCFDPELYNSFRKWYPGLVMIERKRKWETEEVSDVDESGEESEEGNEDDESGSTLDGSTYQSQRPVKVMRGD